MPKLDKQSRLKIPSELMNELSWKKSETVAICYDSSTGSIILCDKANSKTKCVIAFRNFDTIRRLYFPKEALALLNATKDDLLVVCLENDQIIVKKPQRHGRD